MSHFVTGQGTFSNQRIQLMAGTLTLLPRSYLSDNTLYALENKAPYLYSPVRATTCSYHCVLGNVAENTLQVRKRTYRSLLTRDASDFQHQPSVNSIYYHI